jgi:uncharacterized protein (DUF736 family)
MAYDKDGPFRANQPNENATCHGVFVARAEIGVTWSDGVERGRPYLSLKLDDPSFTAPIFANLFDDPDRES